MKRANSFCTNLGKRFKRFFGKCAEFFRTRFEKRVVRRTTHQIALAAVFTALTLAATLVISIPIPATGGYVNVGDTMIFVAGALFGPFVGGIAGGLGSMFADLVLGYAFYAPFTFLIKGLEGILCGFLGYFLANKFKKNAFRYGFQFVSFLLSGLWMCAGYFFVEFAYYDIGGALGGLTGNLIQAFSSVALASALVFFFQLGNRVVRKTFPKKSNVNRAEFTPAEEHSDFPAKNENFNELSVSDAAANDFNENDEAANDFVAAETERTALSEQDSENSEETKDESVSVSRNENETK